MAKKKVPESTAEKALNHVTRRVSGIYEPYAYFEERVEAHDILADLVKDIV